MAKPTHRTPEEGVNNSPDLASKPEMDAQQNMIELQAKEPTQRSLLVHFRFSFLFT